jgi:hypothetical protein
MRDQLWRLPMEAIENVPEEIGAGELEAFLQISDGEWSVIIGRICLGRLRSSYRRELE